MIDRKKRLRAIQIGLLLLGTFIIFFTYGLNKKSFDKEIIPKATQKKIKEQLSDDISEKGDIFFNIEYSGLDLAGNRYILKSKEAFNSKTVPEEVNMKFVESIFYFKNGTILKVFSNEGVYNNKNLDMNFNGNVKAFYQESTLLAEKAEYSNSKSYLIITDNVKVEDKKGTMFADKLFFDIKNQKLDITAFNNGKVNAEVKLKWKKAFEF